VTARCGEGLRPENQRQRARARDVTARCGEGLRPVQRWNARVNLSSYFIGDGDPDASDSDGSIDTLRQHIFRPRFYLPLAGPGQPTLAKWTGDVVAGTIEPIGP
jgi:hypothetical protein